MLYDSRSGGSTADAGESATREGTGLHCGVLKVEAGEVAVTPAVVLEPTVSQLSRFAAEAEEAAEPRAGVQTSHVGNSPAPLPTLLLPGDWDRLKMTSGEPLGDDHQESIWE